jgi:hypothetical protein
MAFFLRSAFEWSLKFRRRSLTRRLGFRRGCPFSVLFSVQDEFGFVGFAESLSFQYTADEPGASSARRHQQ